MKVLLHNRAPETWPGGDARVVAELASALAALGLEVEFSSAPPRDGLFDVVHLHNVSMPWTWDALRRHQFRKTRVVLSTIFEPGHWRLVSRSAQRWMVNAADAIVCHSHWEATCVVDQLGADPSKIRVIRLGVNPALANGLFATERSYVLQVGRIEPRKNQLALVKAVRDLPVLLVGEAFDPAYYRDVMTAAGENVIHMAHVADRWLPMLYGRARVLCSPSRFETCGLVHLEAGLAGCHVVVTDVGGVREYCQDFAAYVEPDDLGAIGRAVSAAWTAAPSGFAEFIRSQYRWDRCAEEHLDVYASS